jgi:hypothetical protein
MGLPGTHDGLSSKLTTGIISKQANERLNRLSFPYPGLFKSEGWK